MTNVVKELSDTSGGHLGSREFVLAEKGKSPERVRRKAVGLTPSGFVGQGSPVAGDGRSLVQSHVLEHRGEILRH